MTRTGTLITRYATEDDLEDIKLAYGRMLMFLDDQDFDILPTTDNVDFVVDHIFEPAIIDGRSEILIVENDEGESVSYLFWVRDPEVIQSRYKKATSYGQWVEPVWRGNQLVGKMIAVAGDNMKRVGIERVLDMVHKKDVMKIVENYGFKVNHNVVTLEV